MRNWNKSMSFLLNILNLGCEPTYEELKRFVFGIFKKNFVCCEPTYEELKLIPNHYICNTQPVASLPMRNWNCNNTARNCRLFCRLRAYLWGIETWQIRYRLTQFPHVASLPMRNWNRRISNIQG